MSSKFNKLIICKNNEYKIFGSIITYTNKFDNDYKSNK